MGVNLSKIFILPNPPTSKKIILSYFSKFILANPPKSIDTYISILCHRDLIETNRGLKMNLRDRAGKFR